MAMRPTARTLLSLSFAIGCGCHAALAQESDLGRRPFGGEYPPPLVESSPAPTATYPQTGARTQANATAPGLTRTTGPALSGPTTTLPAERPSFFWSPFSYVRWPEIHIPEFHMPAITIPRPQLPRPTWWFGKSDVDEARNAWVETSPEAERPSPLQAVTNGVRQVGESTRSAWRKTVDVFTPNGDAKPPRVAGRETQPPFWSRMFSPEQPKGPETVPEWMAQERLKP